MNKEEIIKEYDARFKKKPEKWASDERNEHCYQTLLQCYPEPKTIIDIGCGNGHTLKYHETLVWVKNSLRSKNEKYWK